MPSLVLYPINYETHPHYVIRKAFAAAFDPFAEYDWYNLWQSIGLSRTHLDFIEVLKGRQPDYCFMQLQNVDVMDVHTIREMAKYTKIINWTGDVRKDAGWYDWFEAIGKEIHLTLFSNESDAALMRSRGVRADYLQVGFDHELYKQKPAAPGWPEIIFIGNNHQQFELSNYRLQAVQAMREHFGDRFGVYGSNWERNGISTTYLHPPQEAEAYNSCKIALSISNFKMDRYYSDRLLRMMACGAMALSHEFPGMEKDFRSWRELIAFDSIPDMIEKATTMLDPANQELRQTIADNGWLKVQTQAKWDFRCEELLELLKKHEQ